MTTALAEKEKNQALTQIPEHLQKFVGSKEGKENVKAEDLLIPRLCVAQGGLTPQLKKQNENYLPDLEDGDLFNSVTGEIYGPEVLVLPLFFFKNYILFKPMEEGGGVLAQYQTVDEVPKKDLAWVDGKPPNVTQFSNRMCLVQTSNGLQPIVVSFKSTGLKFSKKWNSLINLINLPAFARFYKMVSVTQAKGTQTWHGINVMPDMFASPSLFNEAKAYFDQLQAGGYKVDTTGIDDTQDTEFEGQTVEGQSF